MNYQYVNTGGGPFDVEAQTTTRHLTIDDKNWFITSEEFPFLSEAAVQRDDMKLSTRVIAYYDDTFVEHYYSGESGGHYENQRAEIRLF